ncbi:TetR/AcrR family transcriptional regulator [Mesorhizobium sp. M8A.F.Ca.ET.165.01.1.1]|nr:TetR/AcrR family transcriptional regulator [Mesorhizobium sp. M8A.F.Ca.ET.165.01.1.1]
MQFQLFVFASSCQGPAKQRFLRSNHKRCFLRFRDHVAKLVEEAASAPKGDRTRLRLKLGAIDVLEQIGYLDARIPDIARGADVAVGTFYTYFLDKKAITVELMTELVTFLDDQNRLAIGGSDPFSTVLAKITQYVRVYSSNAGLLRCLQQLCDIDSDFQALWNDTNHRFSRIFADGMTRRQNKKIERELLQLVGYGLAAMVDELLRLIYVVKDPRLVALVASNDHAAEILSVLWYRAVYAQDPPAERLRFANNLLAAKHMFNVEEISGIGENPGHRKRGEQK